MNSQDNKPTQPSPQAPIGMSPDRLSPVGKKLLNMIEFDNDEVLLAEIRKHPFGLFIIYMTGLGITFAIFLLFIIVPVLLSGNNSAIGIDLSSWRPVMIMIGFFLFVFSMIGTLIGAYLYTHDVIIVTSEKLTQIVYKNIFNKTISQLSIGDVQDTTVKQAGIFAHLFNYGTIEIETAGEQDNYNFTYVPDPYSKAKLIVGSHETNLQKFGN